MAKRRRYTYRNKTDQPCFLVGIGDVAAGGQITVDEPFTNPNFELEDTKTVDVKAPSKAGDKAPKTRSDAQVADRNPGEEVKE